MKDKKTIPVLTMLGAFVATYIFKINVVYIILICGTIGAYSSFRSEKVKKEGN